MQGNAKHFDNRKEIITRNTFTTAIFSANEGTGSSKVYWSWNRRSQKYFSRASLGLLARYFANLQRSTKSSANLFICSYLMLSKCPYSRGKRNGGWTTRAVNYGLVGRQDKPTLGL